MCLSHSLCVLETKWLFLSLSVSYQCGVVPVMKLVPFWMSSDLEDCIVAFLGELDRCSQIIASKVHKALFNGWL